MELGIIINTIFLLIQKVYLILRQILAALDGNFLADSKRCCIYKEYLEK